MKKEIRVTCDTSLRVPHDQLHGVQGNLKEMSRESFEKLRTRILDRGLNFAFHVWKQLDGTGDKPRVKWWVIDGHGRLNIIKNLIEKDGYSLPDGVPCVEIEAANLKDAKAQVLAASSSYNKMTDEGLYEFMSELEFEMPDLGTFDLSLNMDKFEAGFFGSDEPEPDGGPSPEKETVTFEVDPNGKKHDCPRCGYRF